MKQLSTNNTKLYNQYIDIVCDVTESMKMIFDTLKPFNEKEWSPPLYLLDSLYNLSVEIRKTYETDEWKSAVAILISEDSGMILPIIHKPRRVWIKYNQLLYELEQTLGGMIYTLRGTKFMELPSESEKFKYASYQYESLIKMLNNIHFDPNDGKRY